MAKRTRKNIIKYGLLFILPLVIILSMNMDSGEYTNNNKAQDIYANQVKCFSDGYDNIFGHQATYQGIVYNDGDSDIYYVKVYMNFYDSDGNFIGYDRTYLRPGTIKAGGKATFDAKAIKLPYEFDGVCEISSIEFDYSDY